MPLFRLGSFQLHSGMSSSWLIDCTVLTTEDWEALAFLAADLLGRPFGKVIGVPRGGLLFAQALEKRVRPGAANVLIADDVLTTGASMLEAWKQAGQPYPPLGIVAFARGECPWWVMPVFRLGRTVP